MADLTLTTTPLGGHLYGTDAFAGPFSADLAASPHTATFGNTWTRRYGATGTIGGIVVRSDGVAYPNAAGSLLYSKDDSLPSPDYRVSVRCLPLRLSSLATGATCACAARYNAASGQAVVGGLQVQSGSVYAGIWLMAVNGSLSSLATPVAVSVSEQVPILVELLIAGTAVVVILDGVAACSATLTTLAGAGAAGLYLNAGSGLAPPPPVQSGPMLFGAGISTGGILDGTGGLLAFDFASSDGGLSGLTRPGVSGLAVISGGALAGGSAFSPLAIGASSVAAISPLAAAAALPSPAAAGLANSSPSPLAGSGNLRPVVATGQAGVAPGPLAGAGSLPAPALSAIANIRLACLAGPGVLPVATPRTAAELATGPLVGNGNLPAATATGAARATVSPLPAPAALVANQPATALTQGAAPLSARGVFSAPMLTTDSDTSAPVGALAGTVGLGGTGVSGDAAISPIPLAGAADMPGAVLGFRVLVPASPLVAGGAMPGATATAGVGLVPAPADALAIAEPPAVVTPTAEPVVPDARASIGPDEEGDDYPFVSPSLDIRHLVADASMALRVAARPPFRLAWVAGIGDFFSLPAGELPLSPPPEPAGDVPPAGGAPISPPMRTHPCDVAVVDADGALAFDSTTATYAGEQYGPYLYAHRWVGPDASMVLVQRMSFPRPSLAYRVPSTISPLNATFCERVASGTTGQLTGIAGGGGTVGGAVTLVAGYNVVLAGGSAVTIGAVGGAGEGRYPGCQDAPTSTAALASAAPDSRGNLRIAGDGCYAIQPDVSIGSDGARIHPETLRLTNDCRACCSCADYSDLAVALSRAWAELTAVASEAERSRDRFASGLGRWAKLDAAGYLSMQVRTLVHNFRYCDLAVQVCWTGEGCLENYYIDVVVELGGATTGVGFRVEPGSLRLSDACGDMSVVTPSATSDRAMLLDGAGHFARIRLTWPAVQPRGYGRARLRYGFTGLVAGTETDCTFYISGIGGLPQPYLARLT